MVKEFKQGTKYFIVFIMLSIMIGIFFYIMKKILEKREQYLYKLACQREDRHAESAIMEEQEILHIRDNAEEANKMQVDLTQYFVFNDYSPDLLWHEYKINQQTQNKTKNSTSAVDLEDQQAKIEILLYYQAFVKLFRLHVISIQDLHCFRTSESKSVKLKILLHKSEVDQYSKVTQIYEMDSDDVHCDDKFAFPLLQQEIGDYILYISLWSVNAFYQEILLGAASIDLKSYNSKVKTTIVQNVMPVKKDRNVYGYLLVALCHVPSIERLMCVVMNGKDVQEDISNKSILSNVLNPFVKVSLINDGKTIKQHKTRVVLDDRNPLFNEMIEFYIPQYQIESVDIFFLVMHKYNSRANTLIGKLMIGNHTDNGYKQHWNEALSNPEKSIARWHPLTR